MADSQPKRTRALRATTTTIEQIAARAEERNANYAALFELVGDRISSALELDDLNDGRASLAAVARVMKTTSAMLTGCEAPD